MEEKLHKKLINDYRALLKSSAGRAVLYHIIQCGVPLDSLYCPEKPQNTAFNCGRTFVSETVKKLVDEADRAVYWQMKNEWNSMIKSLEKEQSEDMYD